jgi:hypothetical protein
VYSHAVGDGQSGLAFHRAFHAAITTASTHQIDAGELNSIVIPPITPMIPPLEDQIHLPISICYLFGVLWNAWFPKDLRAVYTGKPIDLSTNARKRLFTWVTISSSTTSAVLAASRKHSVTLTATIQAVLAVAVFQNGPISSNSADLLTKRSSTG